MAATYTPGATDRDRVRLLIRDTDITRPIFEDAEIDVFLDYEGQDSRRAAAMALENIATNQVLLLKVVTLFDLRVDGAAVARALQANADRLRALSDSEPVFDWVELVLTPWQERERYRDQILRGAL